jgi:uncharacterized protein YuzE
MTVQIGPHEFDHVIYDARRDVLYLSAGEPQEAADSLVTPEGHVLRYDARGSLIGITIINAKWLTDRHETIVTMPVLVPAQDLEFALA